MDDNPTVIRTHRSVANAGGCETRAACPKATQAIQAPNCCTSWPFEETSSYDAVLEMVNVLRAALVGSSGRTVETEVLGRCDLINEETYTGRVAVPTTRQQQLLSR